MKILEIIPQLSSGGAERMVVDLCNELSQTQDVFLVVFYTPNVNDHYANEVSEKVNLVTLNKVLGYSLSIYKKLCKIIDNINPDVIHMHLDAINYIWPFALCCTHKKFYMTIHNDAIKEAGGLMGRCVRKLMFKMNRITPITISKQSYISFVDYYKINNVPLIYNGRKIYQEFQPSKAVVEEFKKYRVTPNTKVIINVASVTIVKQQHLLAKVAQRLWEEGGDFQILFVGRQTDCDVVSLIKNIDCPCVHLLGEKSNPLDYMCLSDAFCLVSSYEGLPISLIEAMSVGIVPLCTPVGGVVDLISDGISGLLAENYSERAIYKLLKEYLIMEDSRIRQMKSRAVQVAKEYSIENCATAHLKLFKD